jgi:hypothetical protein
MSSGTSRVRADEGLGEINGGTLGSVTRATIVIRIGGGLLVPCGPIEVAVSAWTGHLAMASCSSAQRQRGHHEVLLAR